MHKVLGSISIPEKKGKSRREERVKGERDREGEKQRGRLYKL